MITHSLPIIKKLLVAAPITVLAILVVVAITVVVVAVYILLFFITFLLNPPKAIFFAKKHFRKAKDYLKKKKISYEYINYFRHHTDFIASNFNVYFHSYHKIVKIAK